MTQETELFPALDSTRLARISRHMNALRGGNPKLTVCEEEWEKRLEGQRLAYMNVFLLDLLFYIIKSEHKHCVNDYQKRRR